MAPRDRAHVALAVVVGDQGPPDRVHEAGVPLGVEPGAAFAGALGEPALSWRSSAIVSFPGKRASTSSLIAASDSQPSGIVGARVAVWPMTLRM